MRSLATDPVGSVVDRVRAALDHTGLGSRSRPTVVAVSGGADSLCLLDVLVGLFGEQRSSLIVGHVDHRLRSDATDDARHVSDVAHAHGVRCEILVADVPALVRAGGLGVEEAARLGRYRALSHLAGQLNASTILTGHTRSDAIETVLLHLLRGSGQRGLAGLGPSEPLAPALNDAGRVSSAQHPVRLIRPLLDVDRAETAAYCQARAIVWRDDPSNADSRFLRNRVRQHLLPVLRTYNPAIEAGLDRLARAVREDEAWVASIVDRRYRQVCRQRAGGIAVDLGVWRRQALAVRRRLVRRVAEQCGVADLGFQAVERAIAVGAEDGPAHAELAGGLVVERVGGQLIFRTTTRPARHDQLRGSVGT